MIYNNNIFYIIIDVEYIFFTVPPSGPLVVALRAGEDLVGVRRLVMSPQVDLSKYSVEKIPTFSYESNSRNGRPWSLSE